MRRHLTHIKDAAGGNITVDSQHPCRSTVQGPELAADEEGYVCPLRDIAASGCCRADAREPQVRLLADSLQTCCRLPLSGDRFRRPDPLIPLAQYSCRGCRESHCCEQFEHCIACCLSPAHITLRRLVFINMTRTQEVRIRIALMVSPLSAPLPPFFLVY